MSDEEVLCMFMEPKPEGPRTIVRDGWNERASLSEGAWWMWPGSYWTPIPIGLERCRLIESRLTPEQWRKYRCQFRQIVEDENGRWPIGQRSKDLLHATAEQKISAMASVLRQEVQNQ